MLANGHQVLSSAPATSATAAFARRIMRTIIAQRGTLLWLILGASVLAVLTCGALYVSHLRTNSLIASLRTGKDVAVDPAAAPPALLEARAHFLLTRDRLDEAQPLIDHAALSGDKAVTSRMLYNMANARLRAAVAAIEQGHFDNAIPLVALAKEEYRSVLRHDPHNWDAKYNLDVAMRLVRDLPQAQGEDDAEPEQSPSKLWTDLPGIPKGLP